LLKLNIVFMTVAEYIAGQLVDFGVRYVFGIPGGPSIPYMEAFKAAGIDFILTSHESAAGVMADVTARLTGVPGVCHSTFGPGAANISTGAGLALLDRSPILVFTSEMPDSMLSRTVQMNIDHQKLFTPLTKKTFRISLGNIHEVIESAIAICNDEYPGSVHIGLPTDIANMEVPEKSFAQIIPDEPVIENDIPGIISVLEKSRRPLLAIGLTSSRFGLKRRIREFLELYPMPVVLTPMAKGLLPEDHPCYAGVLFHALSDYLEDIYEKTDLVIGLGYDQVEYNYESWLPDVPLVHFDTRLTDLPEDRECYRFTAPVAAWFSMLKNMNSDLLIFESAAVKGVRDEMQSVFNGFLSHFGPVTALKVLREELAPEVILTADVGSHLHLLGQYWKTPAPERLLITNGWSSMGFGIPSALAAQLNRPGATVVCVTGDGGFLMSAGEMMTARRYGLPVKIIVFSDGELNLIKLKQSWKELQPYGTDLYPGDLFGCDSFLGVRVIRAATEEEMRTAIKESLQIDEPVIINAVIDPEDYKWLIVRQK
jgi:acetolactate synthase-1/2/3 large subunit